MSRHTNIHTYESKYILYVFMGPTLKVQALFKVIFLAFLALNINGKRYGQVEFHPCCSKGVWQKYHFWLFWPEMKAERGVAIYMY